MNLGKIILIGCVSAGSAFVIGCSSTGINNTGNVPIATQPMTTSDKIPATQAQVKVSETKNNDTAVDLEVRHMADPQKIDPNAHSYVVWELQTDQPSAQPQNLGAFSVDRNERGTIETITPLRNFQLFVTAENDVQTTQPTGEKLMWATINR